MYEPQPDSNLAPKSPPLETPVSAGRPENYWEGGYPEAATDRIGRAGPVEQSPPTSSDKEVLPRVVAPNGPTVAIRPNSKLLQAISNPAVIAGIGSTIVTLTEAPVASAIFAISTVFTAINTFRQDAVENNKTESTAIKTDAPRRGVIGLLKEIGRSPGLFSVIQGASYAGTSIAKMIGHDWYRAAVFATFSIGSLAVARLCNSDASFPVREKPLAEKVLSFLWDKVPERVKKVLHNPGVSFPAGNLALLLHDTNLHNLVQNRAGIALFSGGCLLAGYAILNGLKPLINPDAKTSGLSSTVSGAGDMVTGSSSLFGGFNNTALATIVWGISNIVAGRKMNRQAAA